MDQSTSSSGADGSWWDSYAMDLDVPRRWRIGPLELYVHRTERQWRIVRRQDEDPLTEAFERAIPVDQADLEAVIEAEDPPATVSRFPVRRTDPELKLEAALADRATVIRPETPLYVVPGESITLYVSTPVWVQIRAGEAGPLLEDVPSFRPSDTWFRPSTREGELCYAIRTAGRVSLENLPQRRHRAVTPVRIQNSAADTLLVERVQLPTPHLALYRTEEGLIWTPGVVLERHRAEDQAAVSFEEGPPEEVLDARRIGAPRTEDRGNLVMRTFGALGGFFS